MDRNKWKSHAARATALSGALLLALPPLFLAAYIADLPVRIPAFLLPERRYLALDSRTSAGELAAARGRGEAYEVLPDRLRPLPGRGDASGIARAAKDLPDLPALDPVAADLEAGIGLFKRARLLT